MKCSSDLLDPEQRQQQQMKRQEFLKHRALKLQKQQEEERRQQQLLEQEQPSQEQQQQEVPLSLYPEVQLTVNNAEPARQLPRITPLKGSVLLTTFKRLATIEDIIPSQFFGSAFALCRSRSRRQLKAD
jgi:hypothetical protein